MITHGVASSSQSHYANKILLCVAFTIDITYLDREIVHSNEPRHIYTNYNSIVLNNS